MSSRPRNMAKKDGVQSSLIDALRFISLAQRSDAKATVNQTHCILENRRAIAFDGTMAICTPIEEDVAICPHTDKFLDALQKCGQNFAITQLDSGKVKISNAKFGAFVDCLPRVSLPYLDADPIIPGAIVNDEIKLALETVGKLANDKAETFVETAVLLKANSAAATDRYVMLEYWHGLDLPTMTLPKPSAIALCKIKKAITGFGYSVNTATFHFDDGSWLRTKLHEQTYPDIGRVLDKKSNAWPVPPNFFEALRAVEPFTNAQGTVLFGQNVLHTHDDAQTGATHEVIGIPKNLRFKAAHLLKAEPFIKQIDFIGQDSIAFFFDGGKVRGAITQLAKTHEEKMQEYRASPEYAEMETRRKASEDQRRAEWQAKQAAKPWYPGKDNETFEDQDIPF